MQPTATEAKTTPEAGENGNGIIVPFTRGARERTEPFHDKTTTQQTSSRQVGPEDVLAHGTMRHLVVHVTATGGDHSTSGAVAAADAPFNLLSSVELLDVNGNPIVQLDGYQLAIAANKYGAYAFMSDPRKSPAFSALDGDDNGGFLVRIPVEISGRDGLGALKNQHAAQTYKFKYTVAPDSDVFTTSPDTTLPDVRVRAWLESWTQPKPTDLFGNAIAQQPPAAGTMQFWSSYVANVESGAQTIRLPRVGHHIRTIVAILRTSAGARTTTNFPDPIELTYDGNVLDNVSRDLLRHRIAERYDLDGADDAAGGLDTGVFVWDFSHDLDGKPGHEMRDLYLPTTQATELALRGSFGAAGRLTILTNDVAARGGIFAG